MAVPSKIEKLSDVRIPTEQEGTAVVMVGSFAPVHRGHFDALHAAQTALTTRGLAVGSLVLTPNSPEYVERKLPDYHKTWHYERRIQKVLECDPHPRVPTYVDDVSGRRAGLNEMNDYVVRTVQQHLGYAATQMYLVVGSDQLLSMQSHLRSEANRAVCVLRPGNLDRIQEHLETPWVAEAVQAERFIITEREDMEHDISSTAARSADLAATL